MTIFTHVTIITGEHVTPPPQYFFIRACIDWIMHKYTQIQMHGCWMNIWCIFIKNTVSKFSRNYRGHKEWNLPKYITIFNANETSNILFTENIILIFTPNQYLLLMSILNTYLYMIRRRPRRVKDRCLRAWKPGRRRGGRTTSIAANLLNQKAHMVP